MSFKELKPIMTNNGSNGLKQCKLDVQLLGYKTKMTIWFYVIKQGYVQQFFNMLYISNHNVVKETKATAKKKSLFVFNRLMATLYCDLHFTCCKYKIYMAVYLTTQHNFGSLSF